MATPTNERLALPRFDTDPQSVRERVETMERLLERLFVIPGTKQSIGLDVILDAVPVVGDIAAAALGAYIVWEARNVGMSRWQIGRMAGNVAVAGQNEMNGLTLNQSVVVTLPGNTRFYLVLQKGTTPGVNPVAERPGPARSPAPNNSVPSLQELRQLLELKREMSQIYEQAAEPSGSPQP